MKIKETSRTYYQSRVYEVAVEEDDLVVNGEIVRLYFPKDRVGQEWVLRYIKPSVYINIVNTDKAGMYRVHYLDADGTSRGQIVMSEVPEEPVYGTLTKFIDQTIDGDVSIAEKIEAFRFWIVEDEKIYEGRIDNTNRTWRIGEGPYDHKCVVRLKDTEGDRNRTMYADDLVRIFKNGEAIVKEDGDVIESYEVETPFSGGFSLRTEGTGVKRNGEFVLEVER